MHVAVVVPAFNERSLLPRVIARLDALPRPVLRGPSGETETRYTYVVVDDGSTDGTADEVRALGVRPDVTAITLGKNRGKGAAVASGFRAARALDVDAVLIHDADLEYDPRDHALLLQPILDLRADFVIGTRFRAGTHHAHFYWHRVANGFLTMLSNALSGVAISDMECGLKCLSRVVLDRLELEEPRFGVEPEMVAKVAAMRLASSSGGERAARIYEVDVNYDGRSYAEGKKIRWVDGLEALRCIVKYNLRR